jgi:hypothetical protein
MLVLGETSFFGIDQRGQQIMKVSEIINELVYRNTGRDEYILLPDGTHTIPTDGFSEVKVEKLIKAFMAFDDIWETNSVWSLHQEVTVNKEENFIVVDVYHEESTIK